MKRIIPFALAIALTSATTASAHSGPHPGGAEPPGASGSGGGKVLAPVKGSSPLDGDFFSKVGKQNGPTQIETPLEQDKKYDRTAPTGLFGGR